MDEIGRVRLPHKVPPDVTDNPEDEVFFITVCCLPRGENQLARPEVWQVIDETLQVRQANGELHTRLVLAMPDHLHGLFSFTGKKPMPRVIASFKEWVAKQSGVRWQRDFFDHRLRTWESATEKATYIRLNPVRASLVAKPEEWPYQR
jgi:REP element-mobilizing transposase RayT